MKRYLISSPAFNGEVELIYRDVLEMVDCSRTDMSVGHRAWLLRRLPMQASGLDVAFADSSARIICEDVVIEFEAWWKEYGKKINKDRCLKLWDRMSAADRVNAWIGLLKYNRHLKKNTWKSKLDPESFLRNKSWQNDYKD